MAHKIYWQYSHSHVHNGEFTTKSLQKIYKLIGFIWALLSHRESLKRKNNRKSIKKGCHMSLKKIF